VGAAAETAVVIVDNDSPAPGTLPSVSITALDDVASEDGDTAIVLVSRSGDDVTTLGVGLAFGGDAVLGEDYSTDAASGTVAIPSGERSALLVVTGLADQLAESTETVTVALGPADSYLVSGPDAVALTLLDAAPLPADAASGSTASAPAATNGPADSAASPNASGCAAVDSSLCLAMLLPALALGRWRRLSRAS
jgi:hypothetical protein